MPIHPESTLEEKPHHDHRRTRAAAAVLVALALSIGAVACGSDDGDKGGSNSAQQEPLSKSDYLDQVNRAQKDFASQAAKLNLANPSSPKDFKGSLDKLVGLIDHLEQRLDEVQPPESVTTEHDKLVAGLSDYGDVIEQEKGGLTSGDQKKVVDAATKIGKASSKFSTNFDGTITQINENLN